MMPGGPRRESRCIGRNTAAPTTADRLALGHGRRCCRSLEPRRNSRARRIAARLRQGVRHGLAGAAIAGLCATLLGPLASAQQPLVVGSKTFAESYILAEIMAQLLEAEGYEVDRRFGFGGTLVTFEALQAGAIDVYPEYSGTMQYTILSSGADFGSEAFAAEVESLGLDTLQTFGFNNTYALTVTGDTAQRLGLATITDLVDHPELRFGVSHEFHERSDGWPGISEAYGLPQTSFGIEHGLAYRAMLEGDLDVTDAYSTDGDLIRYDFVILDDDRNFFPSYFALPLVRRTMAPEVKDILNRLGGTLSDARMRELNAEVSIERRTFADVAGEFLRDRGLVADVAGAADPRPTSTLAADLIDNTIVHLKLTGIAVAAACVLGVGLALAVHRSRPLSRGVLYATGLLQTIPSIALLALMIPLFGIGQVPAIIALFLYSLLPIVRNTITALITVDPLLKRVAAGMGLSQFEQLRHVHLPLALPHLLAGLRIAAVISIGTATLAAFIGAGGLGEPIVTGLALNDTTLILQGAIPAAGLALAAELGFELIERRFVPAHMMASRLPS